MFVCQILFHDDLQESLETELNRRFRLIRTMCFRYTTKRIRDRVTRRNASVRRSYMPCRSWTFQNVSAARVGFEPNLSGMKGRQPHQKSNGPGQGGESGCWVVVSGW